jgi:hypothetical protein
MKVREYAAQLLVALANEHGVMGNHDDDSDCRRKQIDCVSAFLTTFGNSRWDEAYEKGFWASWEQGHTDHVIVDVGENAAGKARHCNNCRELKVLPPFVGEK